MSESGALARAAVTEDKHWKWMPGMRYEVPQGPDINFKDSQTGKRSIKPGAASFVSRISDYQKAGHDGLLWGFYEGCPKSDRWTPDLDDAGTLGCLLELVREAWGIGLITAERTDYSESYDNEGGRLEIRRGLEVLFRASGGLRADRLVAALKAAP